MVIANIITDGSDSSIMSRFNIPVINICSGIDEIKTDHPTIIYGKKLAKSIFGDLVGGETSINSLYSWTYSNNEIKNECWIDKFISDSISGFFSGITDEHIDMLFHHTDIDLFFGNIPRYFMIHNGRHEVYVCQYTGTMKVSSMKKDTMNFVNADPEKFIIDMIERYNGKCLVLSSNDIDISIPKIIPLVLQDIHQSVSGRILSIENVDEMFRPVVRLSKQQILGYIMRETEYLKDKFEQFC